MAEAARNSVWLWRAIFVAVFAMLLSLRLLPLSAEPGKLPGPDLLLCLSCAWVLRRPYHLPVLLIALVVVLEDMFLMRPPGLWAAVVVMGTEFLRRRAAFMRELSWLSEWMLVAAAMLGMFLLNRVIMAVTLLPQPGLGLTLVEFIFTAAAYPVIIFVLRHLAGLTKPATGERDSLGRPL